tara:strand:- start:463 stop:903 length:441 start_codon:yes stop_codon:yes gene_type:complete
MSNGHRRLRVSISSRFVVKLMHNKKNCYACKKPIRGEWESQIHLGLETGELKKDSPYKHFVFDKHIKCSPSRAQRIIHPQFPTVVENRPQFDMRRGLHWTNEDREKWIKVYTEAWVRLQEKYNPNWITKPEELINLSNEQWLKDLT